MPQIRSFAEAETLLSPLYDNSRTVYTLDTMRALMAHLGNPQNKLKVVHVAGTSGKTSTAYYCAALLQAAGKKVGLTVSPHVDTINERLQINGQPVPEAEFCAALGEFMDLVAESDVQPSYFELLVALAYWEFARRGVDYAVVEVGLGGLLDGTNIVERADKVCVITDIGYDHTEILGDTLTKITVQKAGIVQPGNEVFMYKQDKDVMSVVQRVVADQQATLHVLHGQDSIEHPDLPLFQQRNLGLAAQTVNYVLRRDFQQSLERSALYRAAETRIPARLERRQVGGKTVIIDGSHNQQKLTTLFESIEQLYPDQPVAVLCAFVGGNRERWQGGLRLLAERAEHIIFTEFHSQQDMPKTSVAATELNEFCKELDNTESEVITDPAAAYQTLLARDEPLLIVTGSFYLLNHVRPLVAELHD